MAWTGVTRDTRPSADNGEDGFRSNLVRDHTDGGTGKTRMGMEGERREVFGRRPLKKRWTRTGAGGLKTSNGRNRKSGRRMFRRVQLWGFRGGPRPCCEVTN